MKYRQLGKTGFRISEIGFGAWGIGGPLDLFGIPVGLGKVDDQESIAAISRAYELGVNFFDTADVYGSGHSEELIGSTLAGKDCVIATKVGNARTATSAYKDFSEKHIRSSVEQSLKRLRREAIDLYQLHNPPPEVWQKDEVFELLNQLKLEGKIKLSGVSTSTVEEGLHLIEKEKVDCLQILFNVLNQEPAKKLLSAAESNGVGIIVRVPLASGLLTGKYHAGHQFAEDDNRRNYLSRKRLAEVVEKVERLKEITHDTGYNLPQIALAFVLHFFAVSAAIPGAKTPRQVEQNVPASGIVLSDELFNRIRKEFGNYNFFIRYNARI